MTRRWHFHRWSRFDRSIVGMRQTLTCTVCGKTKRVMYG